MRILFFGDIVAKPGREAVIRALPQLRETHAPDFVIGNVENLAHGTGITPKSIQELMKAGFSAMTGGNHIYDKEAGFEVLNDPNIPIVRPANFEYEGIGRGILELSYQSRKLLIINLMGTVFFQTPYGHPFTTLTQILEKYKNERLAGIFLDFHAEATSEKRGMGFFADGKVSAVVGTHTHVQTNDAQILEKGTAYLTDAGMCGTTNSIIGATIESSLGSMLSGEKFKYDVEESGPTEICYTVIDIDPTTQKATNISIHKARA
jgi:metallophosphoesterase (TIGR00282 family)